MIKKIAFTVLSFLLIACQEEEKIRIATKPMTEQFIIAEMLSALIQQETGISVEISKGIGGGTANIHSSMLKGEFDLYPEYTGTAWLYVLKKRPLTDQTVLFHELKQNYQQRYDFQWLGMYGFNNSFGLAVRTDFAEANKISTYSDLSLHSANLTFGAEYDFFERDDGYQALIQTYDFHFKTIKDLDISLKYNALNNKQIDIVSVSTTDGALANPNMTLLVDNKHLYTDYHAGTVVREKNLKKYPKLKTALLKMDGLISTQEMAKLNDLVENQGKDEKTVALAFLKEKGLVK